MRATDPRIDRLLDELAGFDRFGTPTAVEERDGIPYFVNGFWTAEKRRGNAIHEVSYRACFKAELPEFLIERLSAPGEVVFDPFMGRGTTPVQAALMGRVPAGADINPLSILLARPRLRPIDLAAVEDALRTIDLTSATITDEDLLAFYHPTTLTSLESLRVWVGEHAPLDDPDPDPVADWIRMVAISRLSGHSAGFFSGRSLPPNQAVSVNAQRRINATLGTTPPPRDVRALIMRKSRALLKDGGVVRPAAHVLAVGDARSTPTLADASVDLVVTSPPFLDVLDYAADNWLRCWFAGIDARAVRIDALRDEQRWSTMVRDVLVEQARIVRPGGAVAFEVGEVRAGTLLLERLVWEAAADIGFDRVAVMVNAQDFTKTANIWGVANRADGTNTNRIVLLRRT